MVSSHCCSATDGCRQSLERIPFVQTIGRHSGAPPISGLPEIGTRCPSRLQPTWSAASPESITTGLGLWIPGSLAALGPRNDSGEIGDNRPKHAQQQVQLVWIPSVFAMVR